MQRGNGVFDRDVLSNRVKRFFMSIHGFCFEGRFVDISKVKVIGEPVIRIGRHEMDLRDYALRQFEKMGVWVIVYGSPEATQRTVPERKPVPDRSFEQLTERLTQTTKTIEEPRAQAQEVPRETKQETRTQQPQEVPSEPKQESRVEPEALPQEGESHEDVRSQPQKASLPSQVGQRGSLEPPKGQSTQPPLLTGKGEGPFRGQGFSEGKILLLSQQVVLASQLYQKEGKRGAEGGGTRASILFQFVKGFKSLEQDCIKLAAQMGQWMAQGKGLSAEQQKQLRAELNAVLKQLAVLQKDARGNLSQDLKQMAKEPLPADPQKAILALKDQSARSILELEGQLKGKLEALSKSIDLKSAAPAASPSSPSEKGAVKAAPEFAVAPKSSTGLPVEIKPGAKPFAQQTLLIQSAADLKVLNGKLHAKELTPPINVALVYPFERKEMSQTIQSGKAGSKKQKQAGKERVQGTGGGHKQEMVFIPEGPCIFDGPYYKDGVNHPKIVELKAYLIAEFPVTNEQYADWLNEVVGKEGVKVDKKGMVRSRDNQSLFKTHSAAHTSQITMEVVDEQVAFKPLEGTHRHPVVQVSWFGAMAYCRSNELRLPTEAEWEKAAGMPILKEGEPLTKFRFGFGKDEIDPSWANYRDELREYEDNRTYQVGFYNGETVFTKGGKSYQSRRACSPYGCFDMSGNVRQWMGDSGDNQKVSKGGSYNSHFSELFVAARALFDPEACLSDTGFRVAFDV